MQYVEIMTQKDIERSKALLKKYQKRQETINKAVDLYVENHYQEIFPKLSLEMQRALRYVLSQAKVAQIQYQKTHAGKEHYLQRASISSFQDILAQTLVKLERKQEFHNEDNY